MIVVNGRVGGGGDYDDNNDDDINYSDCNLLYATCGL